MLLRVRIIIVVVVVVVGMVGIDMGIDAVMVLGTVASSRNPSQPTGLLSSESRVIGTSEFLRARTFAIAGGRLDAFFDGEVFEDPFGGFLGFVAEHFAFAFLECLGAFL